MVKKARARLFGSWEMNWIAYNFAHDVALPGSNDAPLAFFMYPQAETTEGRLDSLDPADANRRRNVARSLHILGESSAIPKLSRNGNLGSYCPTANMPILGVLSANRKLSGFQRRD